jgi:hypothetical protein
MTVSIIQEMKPVIDKTIASLKKKTFKSDPIVEREFSRIYSLVGSSQKRHGAIIEKSIIEALKKYKNYEVWGEQSFKVSNRVNGMVSTVHRVKDNPDWLDLLDNNFKYGQAERTQQVDIIAYDKIKRKIIGLEVKRGYSHHDAGKKKKILQETLALRMLIKSYGEQQGLEIDNREAFVCSYYGSNEFDERISINKDGLSDLFEVDVLTPVEEVNHYFRKRIRDLGTEWISSLK